MKKLKYFSVRDGPSLSPFMFLPGRGGPIFFSISTAPLPYSKIKHKQMGAVEIEQEINNWLSSEGKKS